MLGPDEFLEADYFCAGLVGSGQLLPALAFVARHPDALLLMVLLSTAATLGNTCICIWAFA